MTSPSRVRLRRVIEYACLAPSVHNPQPWLWHIVDQTSIELYADRRRQLPISDPQGPWLQTGEALSALWIFATRAGL